MRQLEENLDYLPCIVVEYDRRPRSIKDRKITVSKMTWGELKAKYNDLQELQRDASRWEALKGLTKMWCSSYALGLEDTKKLHPFVGYKRHNKKYMAFMEVSLFGETVLNKFDEITNRLSNLCEVDISDQYGYINLSNLIKSICKR